MRLALLTALVMCAFAGNSILNRLALSDGQMDAVVFGVIRLVSGAAALAALATGRRRGLPLRDRRRWVEVPALVLYVFGFSLAYRRLDAGTGALILFGGVQVVMFAAAISDRPPLRRWIGAAIALAGLALLAEALRGDLAGVLLMSAAAVGWGLYSLSGRGVGDPLAATTANFVLAGAASLMLVPFLLPSLAGLPLRGVGLAVLSGAVTSGLGYALWYGVLPRLASEVAGLAQLCVPVIAILGGAVVIGEVPSGRTLAACLVILGGVALGLVPQRRMASSGS